MHYVFLSVLTNISIFNNIGDDEVGGTPVPMPNTEVKLYDAEDTLTGKIGGRQFLYIPQ